MSRGEVSPQVAPSNGEEAQPDWLNRNMAVQLQFNPVWIVEKELKPLVEHLTNSSLRLEITGSPIIRGEFIFCGRELINAGNLTLNSPSKILLRDNWLNQGGD